MGTNYYHHADICAHCGRFEKRHICKSMISFQGYRPDPDWPSDPTLLIVSWQDWKAAIRAGGEVWDEYSRQWNVEEFITAVEGTVRDLRRRQYDWMVEHAHEYAYSLDHVWIDDDGFSFSDQEFT